ncbi:MAG: nucleotidyl transferase AbiEii/AbiGii toxin family protein [Candidatus Marsarchaeota archaeon]|nr:nucleotidyl transferase AbiEii/AbiGii toxin family protein [Candidatus Marsarchaeota archaeon]
MTDKAAFHGGTCVWRCYGGKRFSQDIDIYVWDRNLEYKLKESLEKVGLNVLKYRFKEHIIFIHVSLLNAEQFEVKIEINNKKIENFIVVFYETVSGRGMQINNLSDEDLVLEKINAYNNRRLHKDLYDITILLNSIANSAHINSALTKFISAIAPPKDAYIEFKATIYSGSISSFGSMIDLIKRWIKQNR